MKSREYDSGADYDAQYSALYEPEIRTLSALALRQGGAVLDLCCGTGIVTVPLAETGLEVVGVDIAPAMLEQAKAKAVGQTNLTFYLQDVLEFSTAQHFGLALMTGNAFQCFLTDGDIAALFAKVYELLSPGGTFIFDMRLPEGYDFTLDDDFKLWSEYKDAAGNSVRFLAKQAAFDAERGVLNYEMQNVFVDGTVKPSSETLKFTPLATLLELARAAGFEVVGQYGGWDLEPLREGAAAGVLELKKIGTMTPRQAVLQGVAERILRRPSAFVLRVAIDGVDGAGKTTFADELAEVLKASGREVIRASVDGFHHSKEVCYRLGRGSPEEFYRDSYDYRALKSLLLDPLSPGGSGRYRTAVYDVTLERPVTVAEKQAEPGAILVIDGIFLHRPELRDYWDVSVWLEVLFEVSIPRGAQRGTGFGSPDSSAESNRRYVEGQKLYLLEATPQWHATLVIDNHDLDAPFIVDGMG